MLNFLAAAYTNSAPNSQTLCNEGITTFPVTASPIHNLEKKTQEQPGKIITKTSLLLLVQSNYDPIF